MKTHQPTENGTGLLTLVDTDSLSVQTENGALIQTTDGETPIAGSLEPPLFQTGS